MIEQVLCMVISGIVEVEVPTLVAASLEEAFAA